jgi:hypothetical protein
MPTRLTTVIALLMILIGYGASPYVAMFQLEMALEHGDAARLEQRIDWISVREGLKQDIADGIIGPVQTQLASNTLPQFGASFMAGIADSMIEHDVTPQNLIAVIRQTQDGDAAHFTGLGTILHCLTSASFDGPARFNVVIATPSDDPDEGHLRLRLELENGTWRVVRAWIPQDMVERAAQRT